MYALIGLELFATTTIMSKTKKLQSFSIHRPGFRIITAMKLLSPYLNNTCIMSVKKLLMVDKRMLLSISPLSHVCEQSNARHTQG